jgi:hypothetical protein
MAAVAQAQYLALEPAFEAYDRIDFAVPGRLSPQRQVKWLKDQLQFKSTRLLDLQKRYTAVVETKQAEPAVCALYKIGLAYQHFGGALRHAPIPKEIKREKALAEEYRAQLGQLAEAPEKKAAEALEYALAKSSELSVSNSCSKATAEILTKTKGDQYGQPLEQVPPLTAPVVAAARPTGHSLLSALYSPPLARTAAESPAALPPLGSPERPVAASTPRDRDLDLPPDEPEAVRPANPQRGAPVPPPIKEEDLLP